MMISNLSWWHKPFPQEDELKTKLARIAELDIALKMKDDAPAPDKESVIVNDSDMCI